MNKYRITFFVLFFCVLGVYGQKRMLYGWDFENTEGSRIIRTGNSLTDTVTGNYELVAGVNGGHALKLDGFTTSVVVNAQEKLPESFTIEAWISQAAYPWNWAPLLTQTSPGSQRSLGKRGFYFGVSPSGELGLDVWIEGELYRCITDTFSLTLFQWQHVAAVFRANDGIHLYINGKERGFTAVNRSYDNAASSKMIIGMNEEAVKPAFIHRQYGTLPYYYSIDGVIDRMKVYDAALTPGELDYSDSYALPENGSLKKRSLPNVPVRRRFGAYYTKLTYYKEWDQLWPVGEHPDIVVTFENSPVRFVFWRGTRYSPAWISEKNFWMADQSVEAWNDTEGCYEHMQDPQCRYSNVRILENTPARVVVHWRYALVSAYNSLWREDSLTGWACWIDEYYYIYPDATAIRHVEWKKGSLGEPRQFQESLGITDHGQTQGDILEKEWVTVANQKGDKKSLIFRENPDLTKNIWDPADYTIQQHHFKSQYDPFIIFEEGNKMYGLLDKDILDYTKPGKYIHWPVGQAHSDGITSVATDRPAHFITFPVSDPTIHHNVTRSWWDGLYGMNDKSVDDLIFLAKSWNNHPLIIRSDKSEIRYDKSQKAYVEDNTDNRSNHYRVLASKTSPVQNLSLVYSDWKFGDPEIKVNGKKLSRQLFRSGLVDNGDKQSLVVWILYTATQEFNLEVTGN